MVRKNKCCIRNCPGLHKSRFSIPERSFEKWQEAVRMPLTKRSRICGVHFLKEDIHDIWTSGEGLNKLSINLKKPRLKDGAIPRLLLDGYIGNMLETVTLSTTDNGNSSGSTVNSFGTKIDNSKEEVYDVNQMSVENMEYKFCADTSIDMNAQIYSTPISNLSPINHDSGLFDLLLKNKSMKLPHYWFNDLTTSRQSKITFLTFFKMGCYGDRCQRIVEKQLIVTEMSEIIVYILDARLTIEEQNIFYPTVPLLNPSVNDVEKIIDMIDKVKVCYGAAIVSKFPDIRASFSPKYTVNNGYWKHSNCRRILDDHSNMCLWCKRLCYSLRRKQKRLLAGDKINANFTQTTLKSLKTLRQKVARAQTTIKKLQNRLKHSQNQMK